MAVDIGRHLAKLRDALRKLEMDAEIRASARGLDSEISDYLEAADADINTDSMLKRIADLEARIAKKYPTAARIAGEVVEVLAKAGS